MTNFEKFGVSLVLVIVAASGLSYLFGSNQNSAGSISRENNVVYIPSAPASSSFSNIASASATQLLARNNDRIFAICTNVGKNSIWLGFASTASRQWGVLLTASASFMINRDNLYLGAVWARTTNTTNGKVSCLES